MVKRISLLILFSLAGTIIVEFCAVASLRGLFVRWESLGQPPVRPVRVVGPDYVQTQAGNIYQYIYKADCAEDCWVKSAEAPGASKSRLPLNRCGELPSLDGYVDSQAVCEYWGTGMSLAITAIDGNGFVYSWHRNLGGEGDSLIHLVSPLIGAGAGFLVGLIVLLVVSLLDLQKLQEK